MVTHRQVRKLLGQQVQCRTIFGTFHGVVIHCSKHHIILGAVKHPPPAHKPTYRPYPAGPWGGGPGMPGGGWNLAIPLAAILGITAIGLHWW
ncbi:hypothetical protein [Alicyclobacillus kakegawensis]|uniref:hypothetical protein n=1 Tax=Alicyclobacillus kakegawensis TaxID=392012 RepID=UPI00082F945B|nr:hypothetical protein [Alicyclobacillus kakegawensis]